MTRAVLFDLDGTLIDTVELILDSFDHVSRAYDLQSMTRDDWRQTMGTPLWVQFRRFTDDESTVERMVATFREWNLAHHDAMVSAYDGAVTSVRSLKGSGAKVAIVTSKIAHTAWRGLDCCGFEGLFEVMVGALEVENPKPHPEPVLQALERLGVAAADAWFVGDSPHDLEAGRAAGVRTAAATWGPFTRDELRAANPDRWLDDPAEMAALR